MKDYRFIRSSPASTALCCCLTLLAAAGAGLSYAETLRVTTWNLESIAQSSARGTNVPLQAAAATLQKLNPDVILLQGVNGWTMCAQLVQALQPTDFSVAICSSFPDTRPGAGESGQVAILSKRQASVSWSERWQTNGLGGFAFAVVPAGNQRLGFFSTSFGGRTPSDAAGRQLLGQIDAVKNWEMNRVQTFVVAGTFNEPATTPKSLREQTVRQLGEAGFLDALTPFSELERLTTVSRAGHPGAIADCVLVEPTTFPTHSQILPVTIAEHFPVTCDLELDAGRAAAGWTAWARDTELRTQARTRTEAEANAAALSRAGQTTPWWVAALLGAAITLIASLWVWMPKRRRDFPATPVLIPEHLGTSGGTTSSYTVVMLPPADPHSGGDRGDDRPGPDPVFQVEPPGLTETSSAAWQARALKAERKAEQAQAAIRGGLLPFVRRWLKQKLTRKLIQDRAELLATQQAATRTAINVDERLTRIERQLQQQNQAYESRIEALRCELMAAKEENRAMIRLRIAQVKAEMAAARARLLAEAS